MSEVQKRQKSSGSTLAGNLFPANCLLYLAKTRVLNKETQECTQLPKQMRVCAKCPPDSFVALALEKIVFQLHLICILFQGLRTGGTSRGCFVIADNSQLCIFEMKSREESKSCISGLRRQQCPFSGSDFKSAPFIRNHSKSDEFSISSNFLTFMLVDTSKELLNVTHGLLQKDHKNKTILEMLPMPTMMMALM